MTLKTGFAIAGAALILILGGCSWYFAVKYQQLKTHSTALEDIVLKGTSEIQSLNKKLGLAQSNLITSDALAENYKGELKGMETEFKALQKKYKLEIASRDYTIANLKGQIEGGETTVVITPTPNTNPINPVTQKIAYTWQDKYKRFQLSDPDIMKKDNESFTYGIKLGLTGYVYKDTSGNVQVRKVAVKEMRTDGDKLIPIDGSNVELVESKFEYINEKLEKRWTDIFVLRPLVSFDTQLNPGVGVELINLGKYFDWVNLGLLPMTSLHVSDGLRGLQDSTVGLGLSYSLIPPLFDSNVALAFNVGTPYNKLGKEWVFSGSIIFYLLK